MSWGVVRHELINHLGMGHTWGGKDLEHTQAGLGGLRGRAGCQAERGIQRARRQAMMSSGEAGSIREVTTGITLVLMEQWSQHCGFLLLKQGLQQMQRAQQPAAGVHGLQWQSATWSLVEEFQSLGKLPLSECGSSETNLRVIGRGIRKRIHRLVELLETGSKWKTRSWKDSEATHGGQMCLCFGDRGIYHLLSL